MKKEMNELMELVEYSVVMGGDEGKNVVSINDGNVVGFCKSEDEFGIFGNMSVNGLNELWVKVEDGRRIRVKCSEGLFVCMKFDDRSIEEELKDMSGMKVKLSSKRYKSLVREDFDSIRIDIMRWVLRVKLFYNRDSFGKMLKESGDRDICEVSNYMFERNNNNGKVWGICRYNGGGELNRKGSNILGKLLVELREEYRSNGWEFNSVEGIDYNFCGSKIVKLERLCV
jgi:predicted NAD-dependent protein-ADP-ribosyltransferase YbiA (DUF1768 family)